MHTIQSVADKTGLTPDVIRVWERRYGVVSPNRTASNQRLYSETDIERLSLLKKATDRGLRISAIAQLSNDELQAIAGNGASETRAIYNNEAPDCEVDIERALRAIYNLNAEQLQSVLSQAIINLGSVHFMINFIAPLMIRVGTLWRNGSVRTCQEHFASSHIRSFLGRYMLEANTDSHGPVIVVATLDGQTHELGATMAGVVAAQCGWNVVYLGPSVPNDEILYACVTTSAKALAISVGYPTDSPSVPTAVSELKRKLSDTCHLLIGGIGAQAHEQAFGTMGVDYLPNLLSLSDRLLELR